MIDHTRTVPFEPRPWNPPRDRGLVDEFEVNERLRAAALWDTGGHGPEDVVCDGTGRPITGLEDGRIIRFETSGGEPTLVADVGGRPLGLALHPQTGGLLVANADLGLQEVTPDGEVDVLVDSHDGARFGITNNLDVSADGTIWFSVSSHTRPLSEFTLDLLERNASGAVYRRDPNGDVELVMDGLVFANGVALSSDESHLLVAETGSYRIMRLWLTGEAQGRIDTFRENLPGFPDNLTRSGGFTWCAFPRPRDRMLDATAPRPWTRKIIATLPESIQPKPSRHGFVVAFDDDGRVVGNYQDPTGRVAVTTGAFASGRSLYVGSLTEPTLAVVPLPASLH